MCLEKSAAFALGLLILEAEPCLQGVAREVTEAPTSPSQVLRSTEHFEVRNIIKYFLDIFTISGKKIIILQLRLHFKKYVLKIQGNNYMSFGGSERFLMNFLGILPDLVMFLMII